ncbi:MAG TPA: DUF4124 domain-containing protein [Caldimonas sp.]
MARWTLALLAALLGLTLALPAQAQWKWRDSKGQTQYSDLPPPATVPEQDILSRPNAGKRRAAAQGVVAAASGVSGPLAAASGPAVAASGALAPKTVEPELEARRKKAEAEEAAKTKAEELKIAAARADNCTRAKAQMRSLDSGIRIARTNEKGEREFLDDQQRADESKHTRDVIAADCK